MRLPSKSGTFAILMVVSAVSAFLLPVTWTNWVRGLFQPRAFLQMVTSKAARAADHKLEQITQPPLPPEQAQELLREMERLKRQIGQQGLRLEQQQERLDELSGLRGQLPDGLATIVLAPVVSCDADRRRATLQVVLTERARPFVREGQWVAAGALENPSRPQLCRQWLIGRVSEVQTRLARVRLVTDPDFKVGVQAARVLADGTWQLAPGKCRLLGRGGGRMLIDQAEEDYFKSGYRVVVVPSSRRLPFPLSVGRIDGSRPRDDSPQHVDLTVVPWQPSDKLTHVYIISTQR